MDRADDILRLLEGAEIEIEGRMPWSSNATFRVALMVDRVERGKAIYKPLRGERPLWDFEPGLHRREVAAYRLSAAMGLHLVPPTVLRDGPLGEGSVQWYVDANHEEHYFTIYEGRADLHDRLRDFAVFDVVANNTDRKSGHVLIDPDDELWGIDHGLCFAADFRLRTVVWEFAGETVGARHIAVLQEIAKRVPAEVADLLAPDEVAAIADRAAELAHGGRLPTDPSGRRYPWPLV